MEAGGVRGIAVKLHLCFLIVPVMSRIHIRGTHEEAEGGGLMTTSMVRR